MGSELEAYDPVPENVTVADVVGLATAVGLEIVIGVSVSTQGLFAVSNKQLSATWNVAVANIFAVAARGAGGVYGATYNKFNGRFGFHSGSLNTNPTYCYVFAVYAGVV